MTMHIIKNAVIHPHPAGTIIDIYEDDKGLYSGCEFHNVTIIFRDNAVGSLYNCLLRECTLVSKLDKKVTLVGMNTLLGCTYNEEKLDDYRSY